LKTEIYNYKMKAEFDVEKVDVKDVVNHLKEFHSVSFNDRRALTVDDFIYEHFPCVIKDMQDIGYGYLSDLGKARLQEVKNILSKSLKYCEENSIKIAKVYDFNEKGEGEWRVCKPTLSQLEFLKFKRWFASAEGYFNKAVMQEKMLSVPDLDILMQELKDKIVAKQKQRQLLVVKRNKKKVKKQTP